MEKSVRVKSGKTVVVIVGGRRNEAVKELWVFRRRRRMEGGVLGALG